MKYSKKRKRQRQLSQAEALVLHNLYCSLNRPKILKVSMEGQSIGVEAYVSYELRDGGVEIAKEKLAYALAQEALKMDVVHFDVANSRDYGCILLKGRLRVMIPKGGLQ